MTRGTTVTFNFVERSTSKWPCATRSVKRAKQGRDIGCASVLKGVASCITICYSGLRTFRKWGLPFPHPRYWDCSERSRYSRSFPLHTRNGKRTARRGLPIFQMAPQRVRERFRANRSTGCSSSNIQREEERKRAREWTLEREEI